MFGEVGSGVTTLDELPMSATVSKLIMQIRREILTPVPLSTTSGRDSMM